MTPDMSELSRLIPGLLALVVVSVIGLAVAIRVKRYMQRDDPAGPAPSAGFTLSDLRAMHRAGQLTDAEFEKAKEKIVVAAQKAAERIAAPPPGAPVDRDSADAIRERRRNRQDPGPGAASM